MTAPATILRAGIRPLTPTPPSTGTSAPLAWSVCLERIESTTADGRIEVRPMWAAYVEGHRAGYYLTEAEATEIARDLADDDAPACLACGAPTDGAETHPECTYDARPATAEERERIARVRGGL